MKRIIPLVFCLWVSAVSANVNDLPINVAGQTYLVELTENTTLVSRASAQLGKDAGEHYYGRAPSVQESWVRVSKIDGKWQGIVSIYSNLYLVDQAVSDASQPAQAASIAEPAQALSNFADDMGDCGAGDHGIMQSMVSYSPPPDHSIGSSVISETTLATFCASQVSGVCILPEIEFVFDTAFQSLFGANAVTQATSLVNTAEGFYLQDRMEADDNNGLNMAFDAMTFTFLTAETFSTTTSASAFLSDIQTKKASGLPFTVNSRALMHVVTGRDFDGGTAGIAFVDTASSNVICNNNGFSSGTTSVVGSGANQIPLTAVVMAHELGHNLGANHDSDSGSGFDNTACPASMHIMSPSVSSGLQGFSDCSVAEIESAIARVTLPEQCFSFPVDVSISNEMSPANVNVGDTFSSSYMVTVTGEGVQPVTQITMSGTSNVGSEFVTVTVNGSACSLDSHGGYPNRSYSCTVNNPPMGGVSVNMDSQVTGFDAQVLIENTISVANAGGVFDVFMTDNSVSSAATVIGMITDPPPPTFNNSSGGSGGGGGGGGGSLGWPLVLGLMLLLYRRYDC